MEASISKYAFFEYLAGRSNPLERTQMEEWLKTPGNHELFYQWLLEWETRSPQFAPNQEEAIRKLIARIEADIPQEESAADAATDIREITGRRKFWLIAASIILIASCGWIFQDNLLFRTESTAYGQTRSFQLEDGTQVSLNSNSSLKVPRFGFSGEVREVQLRGEADFAVTHTKDNKRFVVKTSDTFQVEVLGTEFSVFSRPRATKVALKSGSVRIDYAQGNSNREMLMEPGDLATVDNNGGIQLAKKQNTSIITAWKEQRYVFNGTALREICVMIEENFGKKIALANDEIAGRTITGNFKTRNADDLLKTISEVLDLRVRTSGDSSLITY